MQEHIKTCASFYAISSTYVGTAGKSTQCMQEFGPAMSENRCNGPQITRDIVEAISQV